MKKIIFILCLLFLHAEGLLSQTNDKRLDDLRQNFEKANSDSARFRACIDLSIYYTELNRDSALLYANEAISASRKNNVKIEEARALTLSSYQLIHKGHYAAALRDLLEAFSIAKNPASEKYFWFADSEWTPQRSRRWNLATTHHMYAILMASTGNNTGQVFHFKEARRIGEEINDTIRVLLADMNLGNFYAGFNSLDSALIYEREAEQLAAQTGYKYYLAGIYSTLGSIAAKQKDTVMARQYFYRAIQSGLEQNNRAILGSIYYGFANFYINGGEKDSSLYYSKKAIEIMRSLGVVDNRNYNLGSCYEVLYRSYKLRNQFDSAFKYQGLALDAKDSLYRDRIQNLADFQNMSFTEQLRLKELEEERIEERNRIRTYFLLAGIGVLLLLAIIFYRNNRQQHKAKIKIEQAYDNLKATQQQLVQSEKMASLGELTAGIAHEIQNPLNFVNNFSDVNKELLLEMKQEMDKGNVDDAKIIATDVIDNEAKINHHGKRAEAIVKGMLQHSRTGTGQKEPTDLNALCDEYLRLAYHGLRAKDKSFDVMIKTAFDNSMGKIKVIPQDIGRVILNLINNAFYAVSEKKKSSQPLNGSEETYEPVVTLTTRRLDSPLDGGARGKPDSYRVEIRVADNGNGIPQKYLDKIFQPFFTTKPTGQGTGLGLSLAYDIVKAHNGEIKVETKEGEGSEFVITLPENN
jgi:two-component system NtrC family sensor kinase